MGYEFEMHGIPDSFKTGFSGSRVDRSLVFCVVPCRSFLSFVLFLLAILLSVLYIYIYLIQKLPLYNGGKHQHQFSKKLLCKMMKERTILIELCVDAQELAQYCASFIHDIHMYP
jgi:hypothetical protein